MGRHGGLPQVRRGKELEAKVERQEGNVVSVLDKRYIGFPDFHVASGADWMVPVVGGSKAHFVLGAFMAIGAVHCSYTFYFNNLPGGGSNMYR